jgi:phospholipid/cholesterol/gamma-HCH transport system substrate-binding protein
MEAEAKYTYVGIAVIALIATLVAAVLWLKHSGSARNFTNYTIYFEKQALDGLSVGGDVSLRGIKVGRVMDYALTGDKINRVRVTVRVDRRTPIRVNTVAAITRNFVTGIAQITLITPEPAGPPLEDIPDDESYPVIAEGRNDIEEIAGRVNELSDMASEVMNKLNRALSAENRLRLGETLYNLSQLTDALNQRVALADQTMKQIGAAAVSVGTASERIASSAARAGARLDDTLVDAQKTLAEAQRTAIEASKAVAGIQQQMAAITRRVDQTAVGFDDQLAATVAELRSSIDAAVRTLERLQEPRAALLGPSKAQLGPGEK